MNAKDYFKKNSPKLSKEEWREIEKEGKVLASKLNREIFASHDTVTGTLVV